MIVQPRILLVRHGRSAHVHRDGWIDAAGVHRWREAYEQAGIHPEDVPPSGLVAEAGRVGAVAASNAPRAVASAERLVAGSRPVVVSPLLRETDMRVPRWVGWRMPIGAWALAIGLDWLLAPGGYDTRESLHRAAEAVDWLVGLATEQGSVLAVTHVSFRRLMAAQLTSLGWRPTGDRRSIRHWSAWSFLQDPKAQHDLFYESVGSVKA